MVEQKLPKLTTRVRFPSPAPRISRLTTSAEVRRCSARMRFLVPIPEHGPVAADDIGLEFFVLMANPARARRGRVVVCPGMRRREDPAQGQEERMKYRAVAHTMPIVS